MKVSSVQSVYGHRVYSPNIEGAAQKKSGVSPAGIMLGSLVSAIAIYKIAKPSPRVCSEYVKSLAAGVSEITGKNINPLTLSNVMNKEEFVKQILNLRKINYTYTPENIKNFGFQADFHMHTNNSDGKITVKNLLNEIAEYSNNLKEQDKNLFFQ